MLKTLLIITLIIPLLNSLILTNSRSSFLIRFSSKILPLISAALLIGIYRNLRVESTSFDLLPIFNDISLGFLLNSTSLIFLSLLSFLWIIFSFYSDRLFELMDFEESEKFQIFFNLNITALTFIIMSKNLLTSLVFYHFLILLSLFFALNFLYKDRDRFSPFFTFLFYLKSLLFFFAVIFTYKLIGNIDFATSSNLTNIASSKAQFSLLALYFITLFLFLIAPFFLLYQNNINNEPVTIYSFFLLPHAFISLFIFSRILGLIFTFDIFANLIDKIGFAAIEVIFFTILAILSVLLLASSSLKTSFFYLFFHHFAFTLFALLFFAKFDSTRIFLPIYALTLEFTLLFLVFSNLALYFAGSNENKFEGLLRQMPITCSLLIFIFAALIGLAPSPSMIEKFLILKIIFQKGQWLSLFVLVMSSAALVLFFVKSLRFILLESSEELLEEDQSLAKNIDSDSNLILSAIVVAISIFSLFIINFFHHL